MKANMEDRVIGELSGATESAVSSARRDGVSALSVLAVAASALVLIWGASRFTFFDDESFSLRRYILPMGEMIAALFRGVEPDPPLYYIIENAWIGVVGVSSPLLMRIPSIVFFVAGLLVIRPAAAAWFGERAGRTAQVLASLHPAHLLFGMAARWYSLMFLVVAVLLWMTAVAMRPGPRRALRLIGWSLAAAIVGYTNYFGVVVVGLAWIAMAISFGLNAWHADVKSATKKWWQGGPAMQCVAAGIIVWAAYSWWLTPFFKQVGAFPRVGGGVAAYASSAGRTVLALTSGNLASPRAWWVHVPLAMFAFLALILAVRQFQRVWPIALIGAGSVLAGILSQTMLDKYVMSLTGPLCVLVAAVLTGSQTSTTAARDRRLARIAVACLCIGWLGCGAHLATGRNWSSLRWLDPFDDAALVAVRATMGGGGSIVVSHPAAAYYTARCIADSAQPQGSGPGAPIELRRTYRAVFDARLQPAERSVSGAQWPQVLSPLAASQALERQSDAARMPVELRRFVVIESAEFQNDAGWSALRAQLAARYSLSERRTFLPDPDAELKDKLDPRFKHPKFRIEVLTWDLK